MAFFPLFGWVFMVLEYLDIEATSVLLVFVKLLPFIFMVALPPRYGLSAVCLGRVGRFSLLFYYFGSFKKFMFLSSGVSGALFLILRKLRLFFCVLFIGAYFFLALSIFCSLGR